MKAAYCVFQSQDKGKDKSKDRGKHKDKVKSKGKGKAKTKSKARTKSSSRVCAGQVCIKEDEKGCHHFHRDTCSDNLHKENLGI